MLRFLISFACGIVGGFLYEPFYIIRTAICGVETKFYNKKDVIITAVADVLFFIAFALVFVFAAVFFNFYETRLYQLFACAVGFAFYIKTLHLTVAFFMKKVYNTFIRLKLLRKESNDRGKTQQNSGGDNR